MRRMKKRGPNVLYDLNDLLFFLTIAHYDNTPFWIPAGTNKDDLE